MRKSVTTVFKCLAAVMMLMCLYSLLTFRLDIRYVNPFPNSYAVEKMQHMKWGKAESITKCSDAYTFRVNTVTKDFNKLYIYTVHQNVNVYVDDQLIYTLRPDEDHALSISTGRIWSKVALNEEDANKLICIECFPCYENTDEIPPIAWFGEEYGILKRIVEKDFLVALLCVVITLLGAFIAVVELLRGQKNKALLYVGIVGTLAGIWKLVQLPMMSLLGIQIPILSEISYLSVLIIGLPYLMSMKAMLSAKGKMWDVTSWINIGSIVLSVLLFLIGVSTLRDNILITNLNLACIMVTIGIGIVKKWREDGLNRKLKFVMVEAVAIALWFISDTFIFFFGNGAATSSVGILGVGIYFALALKNSLDDAKVLMQIGMHARQYAKLAFRDALTGFYNRAAYAEDISAETFDKENVIVLAIDLNNLKKCNDTLGHAKGDLYIKESAKIIEDCFGEVGKCYRLGGDEFTVLLSKIPEEEVLERKKRLDEAVEQYNRTSEDLKMGIAIGYAWFEPSDFHFEDVEKRADQMMYQCKMEMKKAAN